MFRSGLALFSLLVAASPAFGSWSLITTSAIKEEFTDNLYLTPGNRQGSFVSTVSPGLLLRQGTERSAAGLSARVSYIEYSRSGSQRSLDQIYNAFWDYRLTPLVSTNLSADFSHTTRPDRAVETTGLAIDQSSNQQQYRYGVDWQLSEPIHAVASYGYDMIRYQRGGDLNMESHVANIGLLYDLEQVLPQTRLETTFSYDFADYAASDSSNYSGMVTVHHALDELWTVDVGFGGRYTPSTFKSGITAADGLQSATTHNSGGWISTAALHYQDEFHAGSLMFNHNVLANSGRSGLVESTSVAVSLLRRLSWEWSASVFAGYYENAAEAGGLAPVRIDEMTVRVRPGITWVISEESTVSLSYEYTLLRNRALASEAVQNKVFLQLNLQYPILQ